MRLTRPSYLDPLTILLLGLVATGCSSESSPGGAPQNASPPGDPGAPPATPPPATAPGSEWSRAIERASFDAMARSDAGDLFVAGDLLSGPTDFGGGPMTATDAAPLFVAKYAKDGTFRWVKTFPSQTNDLGKWSLAADASGGVHVVVGISGSIDFGGGAIASTSTTSGSPSVVYAHLDTNGAHLASKLLMPCTAGCFPSVIARGPSGLFIASESQERVDLGSVVTAPASSFYLLTDESGNPTAPADTLDYAHLLGAAFTPDGLRVALTGDGSFTRFEVTDAAGASVTQGASLDTGSPSPNAFALRTPLIGARVGVYAAGIFQGTLGGKGTGVVSVDVPASPKLPRVAWSEPIEEATIDDYMDFSAASSVAKDDALVVAMTFAGKVIVGGAAHGTTFTSIEGAGDKNATDVLLVGLSPDDGHLVYSKVIGAHGRDAIKAVYALDATHVIVAGDAAVGKGWLASVTLDPVK